MDYRDTNLLLLSDVGQAETEMTGALDVVRRWHDIEHPDPWVVCLHPVCRHGREATNLDRDELYEAIVDIAQRWHDRLHPDGWAVCLEQPCHALKALGDSQSTFTGARR